MVSRRLTGLRHHEEVVEAGDVYYLAPGHGIRVDADPILIAFNPLVEWQQLMAFAERNLPEFWDDRTDSQ